MIIHNNDRKLDGRKANLLSMGGRITFNSILSAIPIDYLSLFRMPVNVIHRIDRARKNFLWRGPRGRQGNYHLANWKMVYKSKSFGGMGIIALANINNALLFKWLWKFANGIPSLWVKVIQDHYFRRGRSWTKGRAPSLSRAKFGKIYQTLSANTPR